MNIVKKIKMHPILTLFYLPRLLGLFLTVLILIMLFGQGLPDVHAMMLRERLMTGCMIVMLLGLITGFRWDMAGALGILTGFTFAVLIEKGFPGGWVFPLLLLTGLLYLASFIVIPPEQKKGAL
ncbi:hypothetical protein JXO52_11870 [bacterium]|nr:hypothetical protein [bacterium]